MKIKYLENSEMNHHEICLSCHPKNKDKILLLMKLMKETLGEINVFDEYHNHYIISILAIYYIEVIDHKTFVYTKNNVYRINQSLTSLKKELKKFRFYQINVRTLVNKNHIHKYCVCEECRRNIYLDNQEVLVVNRHYKNDFEKIMTFQKNTNM